MKRRLPFVAMAVTVALVLAGCSAGESGEEVTAVAAATTVTAGDVADASSDYPTTSSTVEDLEAAEPEAPPVPEESIVRDSWVTATTETEELYPLRVRVSGTDIDATIIDLDLNSDGTLEVPKDYSETGWYTGRSVPGEVGPSVVVGHVDSTKGPAVFYELRALEVGDLIEVDRSDGLIAWFEVSEVTLVDKLAFPTDRVYGATDKPELRLITCGGSFDEDARSYRGNVIVFAEHLGNFETELPVDAAT